VRRLAYAAGIRYRVQARDLPGTPDMVNRRARWAVFVHGCFWHAHRSCPLWRLPRSNQAFWRRKFRQNTQRDAASVTALEALGYRVLVVWQCEIGDADLLRVRLVSFTRG